MLKLKMMGFKKSLIFFIFLSIFVIFLVHILLAGDEEVYPLPETNSTIFNNTSETTTSLNSTNTTSIEESTTSSDISTTSTTTTESFSMTSSSITFVGTDTVTNSTTKLLGLTPNSTIETLETSSEQTIQTTTDSTSTQTSNEEDNEIEEEQPQENSQEEVLLAQMRSFLSEPVVMPRKLEKQVKIDFSAPFTCKTNNFSIDISNRDQIAFEIELLGEKPQNGTLEIGSLPLGIDITFLNTASYTWNPGQNDSVAVLRVVKQPNAEKGNFSIVILYTNNSTQKSSICQVNIINL